MLSGPVQGSRRHALLGVLLAPFALAFALVGAAPPVEADAEANFRLSFDNAHSQYAEHPRVLIWGRAKGIRYRFEVTGQEPRTVRVAAVHRGSGKVVRRWRLEDVEPGERQTIRWKGFSNGRPAPGGRYFFRVVDVDERARASRQQSSGRRAFNFRLHQFPIPGPVGWGDGWGAGRGHKGQDLFTRCGRPVRAARRGVVTWKRYGSSAGYYVVIRGLRNNRDYVYMHLRKRRPVKVGQRVNTGQRIGFVGATGNASGCHLHFELWRGRWFDGGRPMPAVTRQLRRWRGWS